MVTWSHHMITFVIISNDILLSSPIVPIPTRLHSIYTKPYLFIFGNRLSFCNVVATWPHHMISLIIISNNIPLSPPIALTYHLIPIGLHSWYTKLYPSIVGNWLSYITLLRSAPAIILLLRSAPSVIVLCWNSLLLFFLLFFLPYDHWAVGYTSLL